MEYLVSGFFKRKLFSVFSSFIFTIKLYEVHFLSYLLLVFLSKGKRCTNASNILLYVQSDPYHFFKSNHDPGDFCRDILMPLSLMETTYGQTMLMWHPTRVLFAYVAPLHLFFISKHSFDKNALIPH